MARPVKPQFQGVREASANIGRGRGSYTSEMFQADFPQFFTKGTVGAPAVPLLPPAILEVFVRQANASIQPDKWVDGWRYACGLYTAHNAALFLRTYAEGSDSPAQAAATGALVGVVTSAKLGQDSVTYGADALTKATADWGDLNATQYGQLLAPRARLAGMGGTCVL